MVPCQQLVQITAELFIQVVVFSHPRKRSRDHHALGLANYFIQLQNGIVGNLLTIAHARLDPVAHHALVGDHTSDHQWSKQIALTTLITTRMQREPLGIMHIIIAETCLAGNFCFEDITHKVFGLLALHYQLAALIADYIHPIALERELRVSHVVMRPLSRRRRIQLFPQML